jgi:hypothetical protein
MMYEMLFPALVPGASPRECAKTRFHPVAKSIPIDFLRIRCRQVVGEGCVPAAVAKKMMIAF